MVAKTRERFVEDGSGALNETSRQKNNRKR